MIFRLLRRRIGPAIAEPQEGRSECIVALKTVFHIVPARATPDGVGDYQKRLIAELRRGGSQYAEHRVASLAELPSTVNDGVLHVQLPLRTWRKNPFVAFLGAYVRLRYRAPLIVTLHEWQLTHPLRRAINFPVIAMANAMIFPTDDVGDAAFDALGHLPWRHEVSRTTIPIGPNISAPTLAVASDAAPFGSIVKKRIGYFGFLYPGKLPIHMLDVFARIAEQRPDVEFDIVGDFLPEFRDERARFAETIDSPPLRGRVAWHGHQPDEAIAMHLLARCDAFLMFNRRGFTERNGSALTCLQLGVPLVSSTPPPGEVLSPQLTGLVDAGVLRFVDNTSIEDAAASVLSGIDAPPPRRAYSADAAWRDICLQHEQVYRQVLGQ